jgi:hypothetical protein
MPHRALQYGSHTWPSRPELTILQSSDTKASSAYSVNTQAELDPPAHLVTQFSPDEHVEWHFLKRDSQSTLRQRIERRDGHCVFSGWSAGWEAARLVRSFNSNWVSLAATDVVLWPDSHSQALAHITCTRAPLSHHSVAELNKIEGIYDPRVAAAMTSTLHKFYDTFLWAPATVGLAIRHSVVLNILAAGRRRRFSYYGSAGPCWRRVSLHQMVLTGPPFTGSVTERGVVTSKAIKSCKRPYAVGNRPTLNRLSKKPPITEQVDGKPFDIYVDFGLGARVLANFSTPNSVQLAKASPLCQEYAENRERLARLRAGIEPE